MISSSIAVIDLITDLREMLKTPAYLCTAVNYLWLANCYSSQDS